MLAEFVGIRSKTPYTVANSLSSSQDQTVFEISSDEEEAPAIIDGSGAPSLEHN